MTTRLSHKSGTHPIGVYLATAVFVFFSSLSAADSVGFVPYYIDGTEPAPRAEVIADAPATDAPVVADASATDMPVDIPRVGYALSLDALPQLGDQSVPEAPVAAAAPKEGTVLPVSISIPAIDLNLKVQNTQSRDDATLDAALEKGPVRYMDSAKLGGAGNMLIFAHSSHLPIVHNKMYQAFNRLPELAAGDSITIKGADGVSYLYQVTSVRKADATETMIDLSPAQSAKLTLSTCDTLTSKTSRFVVEADFVGTL